MKKLILLIIALAALATIPSALAAVVAQPHMGACTNPGSPDGCYGGPCVAAIYPGYNGGYGVPYYGGSYTSFHGYDGVSHYGYESYGYGGYPPYGPGGYAPYGAGSAYGPGYGGGYAPYGAGYSGYGYPQLTNAYSGWSRMNIKYHYPYARGYNQYPAPYAHRY